MTWRAHLGELPGLLGALSDRERAIVAVTTGSTARADAARARLDARYQCRARAPDRAGRPRQDARRGRVSMVVGRSRAGGSHRGRRRPGGGFGGLRRCRRAPRGVRRRHLIDRRAISSSRSSVAAERAASRRVAVFAVLRCAVLGASSTSRGGLLTSRLGALRSGHDRHGRAELRASAGCTRHVQVAERLELVGARQRAGVDRRAGRRRRRAARRRPWRRRRRRRGRRRAAGRRPGPRRACRRTSC